MVAAEDLTPDDVKDAATFFVSASGSDTAGGVAVATFWALVLDRTVVATGQ